MVEIKFGLQCRFSDDSDIRLQGDIHIVYVKLYQIFMDHLMVIKCKVDGRTSVSATRLKTKVGHMSATDHSS